ncbi:MAG: SHOCT domain-containing protein [Holophagaceae bacterium]
MHVLRTALVVTVLAGLAPLQAAPPTSRRQWDLSPFSWLRRSPAEPGAAPNSHPIQVSPKALEQALGTVMVAIPEGDEHLFDPNESADLSRPLSEALAVARPGEDIELVSTTKRTGAVSSYALTVTARVFVVDGKLNILIHDARLDVAFAYTLTLQMPQYKFGSRTKASAVALKAEGAENRRPDWVVLPLTAVAPPPLVVAAPAPAATPAPPRPAPAPAPSPSLEQRFLRLKQLREQNLITEEEFAKRKQELLKEL